MSSFKNNIPKSWAYTSLGEAYEVIGGGTPSTEKPEYWGGDTSWITSADIEGVRQINVRKYVSDKGIAGSTTCKVPPKTLLVVTRVGLGKIAISDSPICFSQDLQGLVQKPELICPEYTLYLLSYELQILKFEGRGTTISGVTKKQLKDLGFPLPPINEQKRIVAKIEELFSELDKGIESFKTASEQLKVYRQALLKHAFEGKLTAKWREENKEKLETADALLKRIQAERAERYRQQVKEWEKAVMVWEKDGKQGSKPGKPSQPKQLPPLTAEELAELPEGWGWARLGNISECLDSLRIPINKAERNRRQGEVPYYGANGQVGWIDDFLFDEPLILVVEDETFTGREKPFSYKIEGKSWVNNHAHILKPLPRIEIDFLNYQLFYYPLTKRTTGTTGRKKLTQEALITAPLKICSNEEQKEVVAQLEAKLSEVDQLDQTITTALQQAETLRQSILKKAFSGQLVAQDTKDEPAVKLLARIKTEKAAQEKPAKQKVKIPKPRTKKD